MPRIGHIAFASAHPGKAAEFFKEAFGFREVQRFGLDPARPDEAPNPSGVSLTDGAINLTFLKVDADNLAVEEGFLGIAHFGIVVDDLDGWTKKLEGLGAPCVIGRDRLPPNAHLEIKFRGPDGVIFDISPSPWPGTGAGDFSHEKGYVRSGDVNLFYRRFPGPTGSAPRRAPLLIFHGGNYYDSADWLEVASGLARERDVLVWDARGFGESGWSPDKNYSFDAHLDDAVALLEHFGWSKAVVMGHSIGGSYALLFAARLRERAAGLILVDHCPAGPGGRATTGSGGNKQKIYSSVEAALADSSRHRAAPGSAQWSSFESRLKRVEGGYVTKRDPDFSNRAPLNRPGWKTRFPVSDMWEDLKIVACPALIVRGARSDRFKPEALERLARDYPKVEVAVVESGHDVAGGAPDALAESARRFLDACRI